MKTYIKKVYALCLGVFTFIGIMVLSCDDVDYTQLNLPPAIEQVTISNITPTSGDIGTKVIVNGTNFSATPSNNKVNINGIFAEVIEATPSTSITIEIPEGATTGAIVVAHGNFSTEGPTFTVVDVPAISEVDPERAGEGDQITISGTKFSATPSENTVFINGLEATVTASTETSIVTTIPVGSEAGMGDITVTVNGQTGTYSNFIVTPVITTVDPLLGDVGTPVTITGTGFSTTPEDNMVSFNGTPALVTASTATSINTSIPVGARSGIVSVTVNTVTVEGPEFVIGTKLVIPISVEEDDVEESTVNGLMNLDSGDLELGELDTGFEGTDGDGLPNIGLRFINVQIPQGANITDANIQFTADSSAGTDPVELTIYGEAVDNAAPYTLTNGDLSARTLTTTREVWTITETWATDDKLPAQQTVDLSSIVQEIVNRPGWVSGNSINFIMKATGVSVAPTSTSQGREAEGFSDTTPEDTPELTVIFN
ncbi:IPT/TIG domain-containing protein [Flavivirga eckloniae]|uniref:IPT/TIG domain-containing protein n=1 Tax=Flavivirga eckloniae TaxID=1803846 RepID=A0A2K9PU99_9FLAO|nr:IPT/TIG domain-containing protein [Flavivirga eckloniae]AUP80619.1 hypothetical protein C1H87_18635 [Flavivirga eckloniae]